MVRRWITVVVAAVCVGCGLVSGLDKLVIDGGAEEDATLTDAADDSAPDGGSTTDASGADAVYCEYEGGAPACASCASGCCVGASSVTCSTSCEGGVPLACTSPVGCPSTTPLCCIQGLAGIPDAGCPFAIEVTDASFSACVANGACAGGTKARVCSTDNDCLQVAHYCRAATILDSGMTLGVCVPF